MLLSNINKIKNSDAFVILKTCKIVLHAVNILIALCFAAWNNKRAHISTKIASKTSICVDCKTINRVLDIHVNINI